MNDGQVRVAQMGVKVQAFVETRASSFYHKRATAVDTMFAQTKTKLDNAITELGGKEAIRMAGGLNEEAGAKLTSPHHQLDVEAHACAQTKVSSFDHNPATAVDTTFARIKTKQGDAISTLGGKQEIKMGGGLNEGTGAKSTSRHDLEELLCDTNRTAAAIAEEQQKPGIMDRFRTLHGSSDEELKTQAHLMAQAILDLGLDTDFAAHGMGRVPSSRLLMAAEAFQDSEADHGTALVPQAGARATVPESLKAIKSAAKTFDAIFHNVFKGDPETLGAWETASQVEIVAQAKGKTRAAESVTLAVY